MWWRQGLSGIALIGLPFMAVAEGFTTEDLGSIATEEACMERATYVFWEAATLVDINRIVPTDWTVSAFDISSEEYDAQITCAFGPNDETRATLVVYSAAGSDDELRQEIAAQLKSIWQSGG